MASLERRIGRLEAESGEHWGLTDILLWIDGKRDGTPTGPLVDLLESLPIVEPSSRQSRARSNAD